jgi:hypothetical protein
MSKTEKTVWFKKYIHSNISSRKRRVLQIDSENQKLVRRIVNVKPHHEIMQVKKTTKDVVLESD